MHCWVSVVAAHPRRELNLVRTKHGTVWVDTWRFVSVTGTRHIGDVGCDATKPVWSFKTELPAQPLQMESLPDYRRLHSAQAPPILF